MCFSNGNVNVIMHYTSSVDGNFLHEYPLIFHKLKSVG
jgi:hypothetical protein